MELCFQLEMRDSKVGAETPVTSRCYSVLNTLVLVIWSPSAAMSLPLTGFWLRPISKPGQGLVFVLLRVGNLLGWRSITPSQPTPVRTFSFLSTDKFIQKTTVEPYASTSSSTKLSSCDFPVQGMCLCFFLLCLLTNKPDPV